MMGAKTHTLTCKADIKKSSTAQDDVRTQDSGSAVQQQAGHPGTMACSLAHLGVWMDVAVWTGQGLWGWRRGSPGGQAVGGEGYE